MKILISVDWDFFTWTPEIAAEPGDHRGHHFDYGHSENLPIGLADFLWTSRAADMLARGVDPRETICIRPKDLQPERFAHMAAALWPGAKLFVRDSHADAYDWANEAAGGDFAHVLNFDAHHDLGYSEDQYEYNAESGNHDCGDWLGQAIDRGRVASANIIYPDWRRNDEWQSRANRATEATSMTWRHYRNLKPRPAANVGGIFLARSSAWVPPWLDKKFFQFVKMLSRGRHLDMLIRQRNFSWKEAKRLGAETKKLMASPPQKRSQQRALQSPE